MSLAIIAAVALTATACGRSPSAPAAAPGPITAPDLRDFLKLPVASPASCPSGQPASTVGRVSPWTGHVDISVFLRVGAAQPQVSALGRTLRAQPLVHAVYYESPKQAHAEFARLYTCSDAVPVSETPASYRLVLKQGTTTTERNGIVGRVVHDVAVDSVSCDPSNPCVDIVRSAQASPAASSAG